MPTDNDTDGQVADGMVDGMNDTLRECYACWGNGYVPKDIEKDEWEECSVCDGTGEVKKEEAE